MAHPDEDLMRGIFAAFGRGDLDALRGQYMAEDACFHYPGRSPTGGHLLHLAAAGCVLNDLYREAAALGIELKGARVSAASGFVPSSPKSSRHAPGDAGRAHLAA